MVTEAQKKATAKYKARSIVQKKLDFNKTTDADILEWLEGKVFSTYVKELIRKDIQVAERNILILRQTVQ